MARVARSRSNHDRQGTTLCRSGHVRARGGAGLGAESARPSPGKSTLDQVFAETIAQPSMRRDQTDEATIRHLLQETASQQVLRANDDPNTDDP
jgi:hypothetical protein